MLRVLERVDLDDVGDGEIVVDVCAAGVGVIGVFQSTAHDRGAQLAAWLLDRRGSDSRVRSLVRSIELAHRRGSRVALRCFCAPDRYHAVEVKRLIESLPAR